jgi:hypothetical protein
MNFYLKAFILTAVVSVISYFAHSALVSDPTISLTSIYVFFGIATYATVSTLKFTMVVSSNRLGLVFLGLVILKFGGIFIFFPELIDDDIQLTKLDLLGFLAPYFIFLFLEIIILHKWLSDN